MDLTNLSLYWSFDEPALTRDSLTHDRSGHGNHELVGRMPTAENQLQCTRGRDQPQSAPHHTPHHPPALHAAPPPLSSTRQPALRTPLRPTRAPSPSLLTSYRYSTGRPSQQPLAPLQLPSTALVVVAGADLVLPVRTGGARPTVEHGSVRASALLTSSGRTSARAANTLPLRAADTDSSQLTLTLSSLPVSGTLTDAVTGTSISVGDSYSLTRASHGAPNSSSLFVFDVTYTPIAYHLCMHPRARTRDTRQGC
jgi:hypothetical protein